MNDTLLNHKFFETMKAEHQQLAEAMLEVEHVLADPFQKPALARRSVARLAELVESHVEHEEGGGYMREVIDQAPRLAHQADKLFDEHPLLLEQVSRLRILARSGVESPAWWRQLEVDFRAFAMTFLEHESQEICLLQEAFTDDIGTTD